MMSYSLLLESISDPSTCHFVQRPPEYLRLKCPVCFNFLFPEPYLVSCCSNHFCKKCIESLGRNDPCPLCKAKDNANFKVLDKGLAKALNSLEIFCPNKDKSCGWEGPLETIHDHLSTSCEYVLVPCRHGCDSSIMRKRLSTHETERCPKRPETCKQCQTYSATYVEVQQHEKTCPKGVVDCPNRCGVSYPREEQSKHIDQCPNVPMPCTFKYAGCTWIGPKGTQEAHLNIFWRDHISMVDTHLKRVIRSNDHTIKQLTVQVKNQNQLLNNLNKRVDTMAKQVTQPPPPPSHTNIPSKTEDVQSDTMPSSPAISRLTPVPSLSVPPPTPSTTLAPVSPSTPPPPSSISPSVPPLTSSTTLAPSVPSPTSSTILAPSVPPPTSSTILAPSVPSPTSNTILAPSVPPPTSNTILAPSVPIPSPVSPSVPPPTSSTTLAPSVPIPSPVSPSVPPPTSTPVNPSVSSLNTTPASVSSNVSSSISTPVYVSSSVSSPTNSMGPSPSPSSLSPAPVIPSSRPPQPTHLKTFVINRFSHRKAKLFSHYSPTFECSTYSMQLTIYFNGIYEGEGTHISLFANLLPSEYKKWKTVSKFKPIKANILVRLQNRTNNASGPHHKKIIQFKTGSQSNIDSFMSQNGLLNGTTTFIRHTQLKPFLEKDSLVFDIFCSQ